ncbi:DUF3322 domain-containing protein [Anaeromyxobacter sp. Red801]|uniref:DUF3322 domain-containing protein n=1 Tax=Anaeromyxobacter sp. Red801 TaxID=3411632 RepID=UPI003B9E9D9C
MTTGDREWTSPEDVTAQVARRWEDGRILSAVISGEALFPLRLPLRAPRAAELGPRFEEVKHWLRTLDEGSKPHRGYGYELGWTEVANRVVGRNRVPCSITIPSETDALQLIRRTKDADRFRSLVHETLTEFPELRPWVEKRPMVVLEHGSDWPKVLAVLRWFRAHPRPEIYLRQLDIPDVDTKFIETHRGLLSQLLDLVLPASAIDAQRTGASAFEARYGLRSRPALLRMRVLDPALRVQGLSDLTAPVSEFGDLKLGARRVFVTENEINGLAFPDAASAVVIFGLGYGLDRLALVQWLHDVTLFYWGDIDTHGFAILAKLRTHFPQALSLLMDRETLIAHRSLWVQEQEPSGGELATLTASEMSLYDDLRRNRLGDRVRLEQERIGFRWVQQALSALPEA